MAWQRKDISNVEDNAQSKINAAGIINSTLEKLWNESYTTMTNGDYLKWNIKLDSIWAILGGDVKEGEKENKAFEKISKAIYDEGTLNSKIGTGFSQKPNPNNAKQYQLLLKKSLFLRRLQNKQGKGTAYASDDDDDID